MRRKKINKNVCKTLLASIVIICIGIIGYFNPNFQKYFSNTEKVINTAVQETSVLNNISFNLSSIPDFQNEPYVILNNNKPDFEEGNYTTKSFENYSNLDSLGRCGMAFACLSVDTMPSANEERESISNVEPSGWINKKY